MKVIRIYDDRKKFYNNIKWIDLCTDKVMVEYCTYENNKRERIQITISSPHAVSAENDWDLDSENDYYVFLDTRWDCGLIDNYEYVNDIIVPQNLISQFVEACVSKVVVYTLYGPDESEKLLDGLKSNPNFGDKMGSSYLKFSMFQPEKVISGIKKEIGKWVIY